MIHHLPCLDELHTYSQGAFQGEIDEVKGNIAAYGCIQVCELVPGYFQETLPRFFEKCAFAFLDVDLRQSLETCLTYLWPLLQGGCKIFVHEAHHLEIAQLFFDRQWWNNLGSAPPGLLGAITRLSFGTSFQGALGYTVKEWESLNWDVKPQDRLRTREDCIGH